jgi:hypothetical protein
VHGSIYAPNGEFVRSVGVGRPIDTRSALAFDDEQQHAALLAPYAYTLVLSDSSWWNEAMVDLVPIQADATPTPIFDLRLLDDTHWLVASATGGIGVVDDKTAALSKTWIVPRCEAPP